MEHPHLIAAPMGFAAASLLVMSALHLSGALGDGSKPFDPSHAGIAEAVISAVLAVGAVALWRGLRHASAVALASCGLAIVGFVVGLNFTIRGGGPLDIGYHALVLPLLLLVFAGLLRELSRHSSTRSWGDR